MPHPSAIADTIPLAISTLETFQTKNTKLAPGDRGKRLLIGKILTGTAEILVFGTSRHFIATGWTAYGTRPRGPPGRYRTGHSFLEAKSQGRDVEQTEPGRKIKPLLVPGNAGGVPAIGQHKDVIDSTYATGVLFGGYLKSRNEDGAKGAKSSSPSPVGLERTTISDVTATTARGKSNDIYSAYTLRPSGVEPCTPFKWSLRRSSLLRRRIREQNELRSTFERLNLDERGARLQWQTRTAVLWPTMPLFKFHGEPLEAAPRNTTPDLIELLRVTWRNGRGHEADNSEELDETGEAEEPEEEQDIVCSEAPQGQLPSTNHYDLVLPKFPPSSNASSRRMTGTTLAGVDSVQQARGHPRERRSTPLDRTKRWALGRCSRTKLNGPAITERHKISASYFLLPTTSSPIRHSMASAYWYWPEAFPPGTGMNTGDSFEEFRAALVATMLPSIESGVDRLAASLDELQLQEQQKSTNHRGAVAQCHSKKTRTRGPCAPDALKKRKARSYAPYSPSKQRAPGLPLNQPAHGLFSSTANELGFEDMEPTASPRQSRFHSSFRREDDDLSQALARMTSATPDWDTAWLAPPPEIFGPWGAAVPYSLQAGNTAAYPQPQAKDNDGRAMGVDSELTPQLRRMSLGSSLKAGLSFSDGNFD
ncbi:hypothetical protein GLOTRDRAFT_96377 [Gloeophyllum trabeum ATCC 11539]|uniref:Uncharacterized protein n=1 Tax=Gloeophyllum trabeum (strain ATCC 11539 / FP-39264 / Madison 617) TaxID=670483 RepID=S7RBP2_GLOTA|nr:uncharacterized protein GLOTRDRAFT_96377 [Gloeophyllum trabeum ATCC 11539]EPQ51665.1 hypothetical protein GLOTRDRAFT_96377 [Gloeophyllum trabeum ATCC 11539]